MDGNLAEEAFRHSLVLCCMLLQRALAYVLAAALQAALRLCTCRLHGKRRLDLLEGSLSTLGFHDRGPCARRVRGVRKIRGHGLLEVGFFAEELLWPLV